MNVRSHSISSLWLVGALAAAWACSLPARVVVAQAAAPKAAAPEAAAGTYKVLTPIASLVKSKPEEAKVKARIRSIMMDQTPLAGLEVYFDSYFTRYYFPMMTQVTDESLRSLPEERARFLRDLENARNAEVHARLVGLALDQLVPLVQDNYHPAVRYNAMLLISSLNDQEAVRFGGSPRLPEPMMRALPTILAEYKRPENTDAIKIAALIGLSRHLEWDAHRPQGAVTIPAALRTEVMNELLALAQAKEPPTDRDPEGHNWFRRRAIEALGLASFNKADQPVVDVLDKMLRDTAEPVAVRCTAAAALGRMNYQATTVNALETTKELGYLALVACDVELTRVSELQKMEEERALRLSGQTGSAGMGAMGGMGMEESGGMGMRMPGMVPSGMPGMQGMRGMGGPGGGGMGTGTLINDPKGYRFDFVKRRIRQQLFCVQLGLHGGEEKEPTRGIFVAAKTDPEKEYYKKVVTNVNDLIKIVETKAVDMAQLEKDLRKSMKALEDLTKKLAPTAAPPSDIPEGDLPGDAPASPAPASDRAAAGAPAAGAAARGAGAAAPGAGALAP
jgi:hypothetical protein